MRNIQPELQAALEHSRREFQRNIPSPTKMPNIPSTSSLLPNMDDLKSQKAAWVAQCEALDAQMREIQDTKEYLTRQIRDADRKMQDMTAARRGKGKAAASGINYLQDEFEWDGGVNAKLKAVFGINSFRLCQRGSVFPCHMFVLYYVELCTVSSTRPWMVGMSFASCPQACISISF
jgi:hypothetical protein